MYKVRRDPIKTPASPPRSKYRSPTSTMYQAKSEKTDEDAGRRLNFNTKKQNAKAIVDKSLGGYVEYVQDASILSDSAIATLTVLTRKIPEELSDFHDGVVEFLKMTDELRDLPGSERVLKGRVTDAMFKEVRWAKTMLTEFENKLPSANAGPVGCLFDPNTNWLASLFESEEDDDTVHDEMLVKLLDVCDSLKIVEDILSSQMHVLKWDLSEALDPDDIELALPSDDEAEELTKEERAKKKLEREKTLRQMEKVRSKIEKREKKEMAGGGGGCLCFGTKKQGTSPPETPKKDQGKEDEPEVLSLSALRKTKTKTKGQ